MARALAHDERTHLAREWGRAVDSVPLEPALHLAAEAAPQLRDEVHVTAQDRAAGADPGVVVQPLCEVGVDEWIARTRVTPPLLVHVPQLAPECRDLGTLAGGRSTNADARGLTQRGHRSLGPSGSCTSTRSSTSPWAGAVVPAARLSL